MWCWRRMLRTSWFMKRSNISVLEEIRPKRRLLSHVQSQMMKYFGHIARRGGNSLEKVIMQGCVEGRRKPGRPRTRWIDQIKSMVGCPFMSFTTLSRIVRGGVMLLQSRAVSHDRTVPTDRPTDIQHHSTLTIEIYDGCNNRLVYIKKWFIREGLNNNTLSANVGQLS